MAFADPYVQSYADRIAEALRRDGYPTALSATDAAMIRSCYFGRAVPVAEPSTIRDLSLSIAQRCAGRLT